MARWKKETGEEGIENLTEEEIARRVIDYVTSPANIAKLNQCERGEITKDDFGAEVRQYIKDEYRVDEDAAARIYGMFSRFVWSYYIIDILIDDPDISDIRIIDYDRIYVKRHGKRERAGIAFADRQDYDRFVERVVLKNKVNIGNQNAIQKFTDDSSEKWILRFNISTKFIMSTNSVHMQIRKHPKHKKLFDDLVMEGMMSEDMKKLLVGKIKAGESFLLCGAGGSGKTTLMNAMIEEIPEELSIFCVQEEEELHSVREREFLPYHTVEGKGDSRIEYSLEDIATNGLLTDTDIYMIGEIKGAEARDFLIAAHTGAICYASTHAPSVEDAFIRLADYAKRNSDYTVAEIMYMLKGLKNIIFLDSYRIKEMARVEWDAKAETIRYIRLPVNGEEKE